MCKNIETYVLEGFGEEIIKYRNMFNMMICDNTNLYRKYYVFYFKNKGMMEYNKLDNLNIFYEELVYLNDIMKKNDFIINDKSIYMYVNEEYLILKNK